MLMPFLLCFLALFFRCPGVASLAPSHSSLYDASLDMFGIETTIEESLERTRLPPTHVGLVSLPLAGSLSPLLALSSHLVAEGHRVSVYTTDEAIDLLPAGTIKRQAIRECELRNHHWAGEKNKYQSFIKFGVNDGIVNVDALGEDTSNKLGEAFEKAGAYFCGCLLNWPSGTKKRDRDREATPGGMAASNACDLLENFGASKALHPPPGVLEDVLQLGGVRSSTSSAANTFVGGKKGPDGKIAFKAEITFRSHGPLWNDDVSARILDTRERADVIPSPMHPFPPVKGWGTGTGDAQKARGAFRLDLNGGIDFSRRSLIFNMTKITSHRGSFNGVLNLAQDIYLSSAMPLYLRLKGIMSSDPPNAVFVDLLSFGGHLAIEQLKIPAIANSPTLLPDLGTGSWSGYYPSFGTGYGTKMNLREQCWNLLLPRFLSVGLAATFSSFNKIRWSLGLNVMLSFNVNFADVLMVDTTTGFEFPRPVGEKVHFVGPLLSKEEANESPREESSLDMEALMDGYGKRGGKILYVNLGGMVRITRAQARAVMQGLNSIVRENKGMRVLWIVDEDDMNVMPEHPPVWVKIAIRLRGVSDHFYTRHEAVALTLSHCGLTAAQASLVNSKPVVCLPFFGDQIDVAVRVKESGAGVVVERGEEEGVVGGGLIYEALTVVLEDLENFQIAARVVSRRLLDGGGSLEALKLLDAVRRGDGNGNTPKRRHLMYGFDTFGVVFALICICSSLISIGIRVVMLFSEGKLGKTVEGRRGAEPTRVKE